MLCTAVLCNSFNATIVNKVMDDFKTQNREADNGKNIIWYSSINYKRPLFSTKNGNKTKDINLIAQTATAQALSKFSNCIKINTSIASDLTMKIHNALVKYLRSANRKVVYIYVPAPNHENDFANATDSNISRAKSTKDYTIIPVQKNRNGGPAYIEIIAKRKNVLRREKVDHSHIIIKLTQPDANADDRIYDEEVVVDEDD